MKRLLSMVVLVLASGSSVVEAQQGDEYFWQRPVQDAIEELEEFVESINPENVEKFKEDVRQYFENLPEELETIGEGLEREYQEQINEYKLTIYNECFGLPDIEGDDSTSLWILMRIEWIHDYVCDRARRGIGRSIPFTVF